MVGHGGSSAGSYLADPTSPIPSHCASIVVTSTVRVKLKATILASYCSDKENLGNVDTYTDTDDDTGCVTCSLGMFMSAS